MNVRLFWILAVLAVVSCENKESAWIETAGTPPATWRISSVPVMKIGELESSHYPPLYQIRGALLVNDSLIAIANASSRQVLLFDLNGQLRGSIGRQGRGPGEIMWIDSVFYDGQGNVVIVEQSQGPKVSRYALDGTFVSATKLHSDELTWVIGLHREGVLALYRPLRILPLGTTAASDAGGLTVRLYREHGKIGTLLATMPPRVVYSARQGDQNVSLEPIGAPQSLVCSSRSITAYGHASSDTITMLHEGSVRKISTGFPRRTISGQARDRAIRDFFEGDQQLAQLEEQFLDQLPAVSDSPYYERLLCLDDGTVWIRAGSGAEEQEWVAYAPGGRLLARVSAPKDIRITDVGSRYVLGVERGVDDEEIVSLYELHKQ